MKPVATRISLSNTTVRGRSWVGRLLLKLVARTGLLIVIAMTMGACAATKSDVDKAKAKVLSWLNYYCEEPFSPHPDRPGLKHKDYWATPGVEGTHMSIVSKHVEIVEAAYFTGDHTLYKTREEKLIRVDARLKQQFYVSEAGAGKAEKEIEISFYLSKYGTPNGEYLILNHTPFDYDIYFDDAIREYLNSPKGRAVFFRQSLLEAGMQGIN
jgi:hypothetical protein